MKRRSFLKSAGLLAVAGASATAATQVSASSHAGQGDGLSITWLGSSTMLISCKGLTLLTDPCFGEGAEAFLMPDPNEMFDLAKGPNIRHHKRFTPFPGIELGDVDHMILTHMHEDHFDQAARAALPRELPVIVPSHDEKALETEGFMSATVLDWGESHTLTKGDLTVTITAVRADHSENPEIATMLGAGNGYWMEFRAGDWRKTVYWTGDTFPTTAVLDAVGPFGSPDILVPHMGGVGKTGALGQLSMGAGHVVALVEALKPAKLLPIHHSTYELYLEPVHELAAALPRTFHGLDLVSEGTTLTYV